MESKIKRVDKINKLIGVVLVGTLTTTVNCIGLLCKNERRYTTDTVVVHSGGTLWDIAGEYCPADMDRRDYIEYIIQDNDCTSLLQCGDILTVRIYEE